LLTLSTSLFCAQEQVNQNRWTCCDVTKAVIIVAGIVGHIIGPPPYETGFATVRSCAPNTPIGLFESMRSSDSDIMFQVLREELNQDAARKAVQQDVNALLLAPLSTPKLTKKFCPLTINPDPSKINLRKRNNPCAEINNLQARTETKYSDRSKKFEAKYGEYGHCYTEGHMKLRKSFEQNKHAISEAKKSCGCSDKKNN